MMASGIKPLQSRIIDAQMSPVQLTKAEMQELTDLFALSDRERTGSVSRADIISLLSTLDITISTEEANFIFADYEDKTHLTFDEFVAAMKKKLKGTYTTGAIQESFDALRKKGTQAGTIDKKTLARVLKTYVGEKMSSFEISQLMNQLPFDERGWLNYIEFSKVMSTPEKYEEMWKQRDAKPAQKFAAWAGATRSQSPGGGRVNDAASSGGGRGDTAGSSPPRRLSSAASARSAVSAAAGNVAPRSRSRVSLSSEAPPEAVANS